MYRYSLDKSTKKFVCPNCCKHTFVRFVDNETGNYFTENHGRCDRESKCGYFEKPSQEKSCLTTLYSTPVIPINYFDYELMVSTKIKYNQNNFVKFLFKYFELKQVNEVIDKYNVGTTKYWYGATIFWQVDNYQKVRFGKVMIYNPETCKRVKNQEGGGKISSVRAILNLKDFNHKQCLFGLHLINNDLSKPIAIVESEKTAIIMSIEAPNYIWLATGSKSNLKEELLKPLKNRIVVLYPDNDSFNDWQKLVNQLKLKGYKIAISNLLEKMELSQGFDLADLCFNEKTKLE